MATNASKLLSALVARSYGKPVARSASENVRRRGSTLARLAVARSRRPPGDRRSTRRPSAGATTTPSNGLAADDEADRHAPEGWPWTKFVVPSSGSTYHVASSSPRARSPPASSPTTRTASRRRAARGGAPRSRDRTAVTRSTRALVLDARAACASRPATSSAASRAARARSRAQRRASIRPSVASRTSRHRGVRARARRSEARVKPAERAVGEERHGVARRAPRAAIALDDGVDARRARSPSRRSRARGASRSSRSASGMLRRGRAARRARDRPRRTRARTRA